MCRRSRDPRILIPVDATIARLAEGSTDAPFPAADDGTSDERYTSPTSWDAAFDRVDIAVDACANACGPHQTCTARGDGSSGCTCQPDPVCTLDGAACLDPATAVTCATDAQGCRYRLASSACAAGKICQSGACVCSEQSCSGACVSTSSITWYHDADADGYGDASASIVLCTQPAGYVADHTDCCDTDAAAHPGQTGFFPNASACGTYDYNCDGAQESTHAALASCGSDAPSCVTKPDGTCLMLGCSAACASGPTYCNGSQRATCGGSGSGGYSSCQKSLSTGLCELTVGAYGGPGPTACR